MKFLNTDGLIHLWEKIKSFVDKKISDISIPQPSDDAPNASGTASAGTSAKFSRSNHIHPSQTSVTGNAGTATKLQTIRSIFGINFDGSSAISNYGICSTSAAIAAKTVTITGFTLVTGAIIHVKFTYANTASTVTLNVNNTGAKSIYYKGADFKNTIGSTGLTSNCIYELLYNGTQYEITGYLHPTSTGFNHIPTGGSTGQILGWSSSGVAQWVNQYTHPATAGNKHIPSGGSSYQGLFYSYSGTAVWQYPNRLYGSTSSSTYYAYMSNGAFRPSVSNSNYTLGTSSYPWYYGYFYGLSATGNINEFGHSLSSRYRRRYLAYSGAYCSTSNLYITCDSEFKRTRYYTGVGCSAGATAYGVRVRITGAVMNGANASTYTLDEEVFVTNIYDYTSSGCNLTLISCPNSQKVFPILNTGVTTSSYYITVVLNNVNYTCSGGPQIRLTMSSGLVSARFYILDVEVLK